MDYYMMWTDVAFLMAAGVTFAFDMGPVPPNATEAFLNLEEVYLPLATAGELQIRLFAFTPLSAWYTLIRSTTEGIQAY